MLSCLSVLLLSIFKIMVYNYNANKDLMRITVINSNLENSKIWLINNMCKQLNILYDNSEDKSILRNKLMENKGKLDMVYEDSKLYYAADKDKFVLISNIKDIDSEVYIYSYEISQTGVKLICLKKTFLKGENIIDF